MKWLKREHGQTLVMAALLLPVIIGFSALAIDVGFFMHTRTKLQADADAMALAAVRDLCGTATCETMADATADAYATNNSLALAEINDVRYTTTCSGDAAAGRAIVTVEVTRNNETFLARILGITDADIPACATARIGAAKAGFGILPFGFHYTDPYPGANPDDVCYFYEIDGSVNSSLWNDPCLVKIPSPADSWGSGNAGAVRLDEGGPVTNYDGDCNPGSNGASEYQENIEDGSECWYAVADEITPKTGNVKGPTCDGFLTRLAGNTDTFTDVFGTPNAAGIYTNVNVDSPRFGIIPIVTASGSGTSATITIMGFITVYIQGSCSGANCNGNGTNPACVLMTPVKSNIFLSGIEFAGGGATPIDNALRVIKIIE